jgi:hypothetical protein
MITASLTCRRFPAWVLGVALVVGVAQAPRAAGGEGGKHADDKFGFSLTAPESWKAAPLQGISAPGVVRAAWEGPKGSTIVAFVQQPGKPFSPRFLLDASAQAMKDKLGAEVLAQEVRTVGDMKAMWLVVKGKGTGGALTGKGELPTTQHWVAIPRGDEVIVLLLTGPATEHDANRKAFDKALGTLKLKGSQTPEQSQSK